MSKLNSLLTVGFIAVLLSCSQDRSDNLVAKVNHERLSLDELALMFPEFMALDSLQKSLLVENWIRERKEIVSKLEQASLENTFKENELTTLRLKREQLEKAVAEMLTGTDLPPDHIVAALEPRLGKATVEKIAINAVMAGCKPEYLPVVRCSW